jgi:hypothetical protein
MSAELFGRRLNDLKLRIFSSIVMDLCKVEKIGPAKSSCVGGFGYTYGERLERMTTPVKVRADDPDCRAAS